MDLETPISYKDESWFTGAFFGANPRVRLASVSGYSPYQQANLFMSSFFEKALSSITDCRVAVLVNFFFPFFFFFFLFFFFFFFFFSFIS